MERLGLTEEDRASLAVAMHHSRAMQERYDRRTLSNKGKRGGEFSALFYKEDVQGNKEQSKPDDEGEALSDDEE